MSFQMADITKYTAVRIFRKILAGACLLLVMKNADAQSIGFNASTSPLVYSPTAATMRVVISGDASGPVVGSMKLKFRFLKDSSSIYYADTQDITYTIVLQKSTADVTLSLNPTVIGKTSSIQVNPPILYVTSTQGTYTNFYDTSRGFQKGKYQVTAEYTRVSNGAVITSSTFKWSLQHITLPPKILSPARGSVTKDSLLFKDYIYDSTVMAGTKQLNIYKNSNRALLSTVTLSDNLTDSFQINLTNITAAAGVVSLSGTNSLPPDTYKLVLSYQDRVGHTPASDSTVITLKSATTPPVLYTAKNTVFNSKNPNGPISYLLPDSASTASLVLRNITDGSYTGTFPLPTTSGSRQNFSLDPAAALTDGKYEQVVSYRDYLLNPSVSVTDTVFFQRTTAAPVITSPANWQTLKSPIIIKDAIPGTILPGSKTMVISGTSKTGVTTTITFQLNDSQNDSVYYDCVNNPTSNGTVVSMTSSNAGSTVLPDGNYAITLSYRDQYGNQVTAGAPVNFTLKTSTNAPVIWSKVTVANHVSALNFNFTLPDVPMANATVLVLKKGTQADSLFLQPQNTTASQSFTWLSNTDPTAIAGSPVVSASPALPNGIPDGTYQVSLVYKDQLGNAAATATGEDIYVRNNNPAITPSGSLDFCYGDSVILTSSAAHGNKWYLNNSAIDTGATLTAKNAGVYKLASDFDNYASIVDSVFVTLKQLPNIPVTQNISYYVQDTIATSLVAQAAVGCTLRWYGTNATGGTMSLTAPIPRTSVAGTFNYYISQLNNTNGCESSRSMVSVTIVPLPPGVDKNGKVGSKESLQKNGKIIEVIKTGN